MSWRSGGVRTFVLQRLTAVYLALFIVVFLTYMVISPPADFHSWQAWIASPLVNVSFIAFWVAVMLHAWVGARDVIMDYVHDDALRFIVLCLVGIFLIFMFLWVFKALIMVSIA